MRFDGFIISAHARAHASVYKLWLFLIYRHLSTLWPFYGFKHVQNRAGVPRTSFISRQRDTRKLCSS